MILEQTIADRADRVLIARGTQLDEYLIESMRKMGITGVYIRTGVIEDKDSEEQPVITAQVQQKIDKRQVKDRAKVINYGKMKKIQIINGPNLNLLGKREPTVYGNASFEGYLSELRAKYPQCEIAYFQSNVEGEMINKIHEVGFDYDGIIMNAGAYTHTSIALHDAIKAVTTPVVEVHISNVHARESFRHVSMISAACKGVILGFGLDSYRLAVEAVLQLAMDN